MQIQKSQIPAAGDLLRYGSTKPIRSKIQEIQVSQIPNLRRNPSREFVAAGPKPNQRRAVSDLRRNFTGEVVR
ncbi:hypothetical protein ACFX2G_039746 [Malus domestica]